MNLEILNFDYCFIILRDKFDVCVCMDDETLRQNSSDAKKGARWFLACQLYIFCFQIFAVFFFIADF